MRFGGHQTFPIREGWLFKGLRLAFEDPERFADPDLADWLGVGKNMAKAICHWLLATGLTQKDPEFGARSKVQKPTPFGETIWDKDRYFLRPGTWWAIHVQLLHRPDHAFSWHWFFNHFSSSRFERPVCAEALRRHLSATGQRMPSSRTLDRDINCLLRSYAVSVPREQGDPEDALECPLSELGLLLHSKQSGFFHLSRELKPIPFPVFGFALSRAREFLGARAEEGTVDLSLGDLTHGPNAPGRVFALTAEATYELVADYESQRFVRLDGQAGERVVRLSSHSSGEWLDLYYDSFAGAEGDAA